MKRIIVKSRKRRDGKHKVTYIYQGEPNMFGGRYPAKVFNKLHTAEQILTHTLYEGDTLEGKELLS